MFVIIMCILAFVGAILVAAGRKTVVGGHMVWIVSDLGLVYHNLTIDENAQAAMFFVFFCISLTGVIRWRFYEK